MVVLDAKLRHMREDIAAIESSNNSLEMQVNGDQDLRDQVNDGERDLRGSGVASEGSTAEGIFNHSNKSDLFLITHL